MTDETPYDNQTFILDMGSEETKLSQLAAKAKLLPTDYLENYLDDYVEMELYREAAVVKREMDSRAPKYKYYLTTADGKMTELKGVINFELPKFKL